jgi:hypothetical protein
LPYLIIIARLGSLGFAIDPGLEKGPLEWLRWREKPIPMYPSFKTHGIGGRYIPNNVSINLRDDPRVIPPLYT